MKEETTNALAKLAGVRKALQNLLDQAHLPSGYPIGNFAPEDVGHYFDSVFIQIDVLRSWRPELYGDFKEVDTEPNVEMNDGSNRFRLSQLQALARDIDQIFEVRANSQLAPPSPSKTASRVFISHDRAHDWMAVQQYIEKDVGIPTLELALEPNLGRTVLQKLEEESEKCSAAVIVATGDDLDGEGNLRARENVMHEIGYLQAKYGISRVCLLHQEGTSIPSNIQGLVYIPFPEGYVNATFGLLTRELKAFFNL